MGALIDIIIVLLYLFTIYLAARRGFIKTLLDLVAVYFGFVIALVLSQQLSEFIYDTYIRSIIINKLISAIPESVQNLSKLSIEEIVGYLPAALQLLITNFGLTQLVVDAQLPEIGVTATTIEQIYLAPIVLKIVRLAALVIIFIVLTGILKIIARLISEVIKKSFLRKINLGLGAALGAVKGIVFVGILTVALILIASILPNTNFSEGIAGSKICSFVVSCFG